MKLILAIVAALVAVGPLTAGPAIMIQAAIDKNVVSKDEIPGWVLENPFDKEIRDRFPCADCLTKSDVANMASFARQQSLLGLETDQVVEHVVDAIGSRHLVTIKLSAPVPSTWILSATWLDSKNAKMLARAMETLPPDPGLGRVVEACQRMAVKVTEQAAYFEICPYLGPVKFRIHSTRKKEKKLNHPVYCNGQDSQYVKTESEDRVADTNLDLRRTGRAWATGTGTFSWTEFFDLLEQDPCHDCGGGRKGVRIYTETRRETTKVDSLSEQSRQAVWHLGDEMKQICDVRLGLRFYENGTYKLELKVASKTGTRHVQIERKAEGNCATKVDEPKEDYYIPTDIGLPYVIGPFKGSPQDKVLTGKEEFKQKDPVSEEETTIEVEFELRRD